LGLTSGAGFIYAALGTNNASGIVVSDVKDGLTDSSVTKNATTGASQILKKT